MSKDYSKIFLILYPFLKLDQKNKVSFVLIILFSLFVIFFDLITFSVLALVFFDAQNFLIKEIDVFLLNINNFLNLDYDFLKLLIIVISLILRNIFFILQDYIIRSFVFNQYNLNSKNLFNIYANSDIKKFKSKSIHHYIKNLNKETWYCYLGILFAILYMTIDIFYLVIILISAGQILNLKLHLDIIFLITIFFLLLIVILLKLKKFGKKREISESKYYRDTLNILKSYLEIKIYDKISFFTESYYKYLKQFSNTLVLQSVINLTPKAIIETLIAFFLLYYVLKGGNFINLELFALIGFVLFRLTPVLIRIIQNLNLIIFNYPSSKILINEEREYNSKKNDNVKKLDFKINSITLYSANFKFGNNIILKNFNYEFKKGKIYGIYGKSGIGKTTLMMILSGLLKLNSGKMFLNGINFTKKNIYWGQKIGFMSQYNVMIDDSLYQTIFLDKNFDPKLLKKARIYLKKFNLKKIIKYLSPKYDGKYSLEGILSGGERQRLAIIRTILLSDEILFLDEPTASLDYKNEKVILAEIKKLKKNKLVIISTHKNELSKYFDKCIQLS